MNMTRRKTRRRAVSWALAAAAGLALAFSVVARPSKAPASPAPSPAAASAQARIAKDGEYTTKDEVALYIRTYKGALPRNFITKREARALGWTGGPLEPFAPGKSIGGDRFGNMEGYLPKQYHYTECDIDTIGKKSRGVKRIVFADGGVLVYYTEDHYETFELLYGEE